MCLPNEFKKPGQVPQRMKLFLKSRFIGCVIRGMPLLACHSNGAFAHGVKLMQPTAPKPYIAKGISVLLIDIKF
jgi:hypothetical protein